MSSQPTPEPADVPDVPPAGLTPEQQAEWEGLPPEAKTLHAQLARDAAGQQEVPRIALELKSTSVQIRDTAPNRRELVFIPPAPHIEVVIPMSPEQMDAVGSSMIRKPTVETFGPGDMPAEPPK